MVKIALRIILMGVVLYGGVEFLGDHITLLDMQYGFLVSFATALFVFTIIEIAIHPLLNIVILPLRLITFGIASIILSIVLVFFVSLILPLFEVTLIGASLLGFGFGVIRGVTK